MQEEIVVLPHFTPEEVEALAVEHERQKQFFQGHAMLDNDGERLREATQRMAALAANGETNGDSYAECLYELGRIEEAIALVSDEVKKAHWQRRLDAILRDDSPCCDGEKQTIRKYFSLRHGGLTSVVKCLGCGVVNVTNES